MTYASDTSVSVEKSRAEIETILRRYGASQFGYMVGPDQAQIALSCHEKLVRFKLPLPNPDGPVFRWTPARKHLRSPEQRHEAWEQACRSRWRALCLAIKAKLETVEVGISSFEQEFLAHIVLPNGRTMGDEYLPQLERAYAEKKMPSALLLGDGGQH